MANELFVDTSGYYSILANDDDAHAKAKRVIGDAKKRKRILVTTDYVLDETATLLKARGLTHLIGAFFSTLDESRSHRIEWTDPDRFRSVREFFLKHSDKAWSFTDCLSFCVMREFKIREALSKDAHFEQAGFVALLS